MVPTHDAMSRRTSIARNDDGAQAVCDGRRRPHRDSITRLHRLELAGRPLGILQGRQLGAFLMVVMVKQS